MTKAEFQPIFAELYDCSETFDPKREKYTSLLGLHWKSFSHLAAEAYRRGVDEYLATATTRDFPPVSSIREAVIATRPPDPPPPPRKPLTPEEEAEWAEECAKLDKQLAEMAKGKRL